MNNISITITIAIIVISLVIVNPSYAFAKVIPMYLFNQTTTIDTDKPLVQEYQKVFDKAKANLTATQYQRALQKQEAIMENLTSRCSNMLVIFKGIQFKCDQAFALVSIQCSTPAAKSQMVFCMDPFVNEYLKSRNITGSNIERFAKYSLDASPCLE